MAQSTRLQSGTTVSSNLTRTSNLFKDLGVAIANVTVQFTISTEEISKAFQDAASRSMEMLVLNMQMEVYPKNWYVTKVDY